MLTRYDSNNRYSKAVIAGGFVFLAGLTAEDTSGGIEEQTASVVK
jgi:enamine deaminase RidA (YjgF/YER057c/UK114 family)